jgi:hypothetical protein
MPINSTRSLAERSVGGVSERAGAEAGGSNPFAIANSSAFETVKGIPVFGMAALFAGRRPNADLGRPMHASAASSATCDAPMTADVLRAPRRGTPSRMRHKAYAPSPSTRDRRMRSGDASFARSGDPCTSILTLRSAAMSSGEAFEVASRLGNPTQVGGTNTGAVTNGRRAARRVPPLSQERCVERQKRKEVEASVPARVESPGLVARTS